MRQRLILIAILFAGFTPAVAQQPVAPLTLKAAVDLYLQNNLELQAAKYRLDRTRADQIAARLRPNPTLAVAAENIPFSGPTPLHRLYEVSASYSETIELGDKRQIREKTAELTVSAAEAQFEDTMRRGAAEVKRLYYDVVLARYSVDVSNENSQTFEQLLQFNLTRFQEGAIPEGDLIKVRLERMKFDSALKQAQLTQRQAMIRLLEKLGASSYSRREIDNQLAPPNNNLDVDSLRQLASRTRPDIRAAALDLDTAKERLAGEHARAKPDLNPFAGYKRVGDDNTVLFGVNIPLKLRDRNQAGIARAEADVKAAEARLQAVRNLAIAEIEIAFEAAETARQQIETFQQELLGPADESRTITLAAYEEGGVELLPVLDAQRTRAEVRRQYFKTLIDYRASLIDLELAVGKELEP